MYIADYGNHRIRKVTVSTGFIFTFAGTGTSSFSGDNGPASLAALDRPGGVTVDSSGKHLIYSSLCILLPSCFIRQRVHR